jgi:hypothetical protein
MMEKATQLAEALATQVGVSRRRFLARIGQSALAVAGAAAGFAFACSSASSTQLAFAPLGACWHKENGITICEDLTESQCSAFTGSTWHGNMSCPY